MIKIALTGGDGLIGSRIIELLKDEFRFFNIGKETMDITNKEQVYCILKNLDFDIFLHLAAYTDVDGAEKNKELAYKINVEGTKNVFEIVSQKKKNFVYISTGFVFDGAKPPYFEDSQPNPISYYGLTKYEGEKIVRNRAMIIRLDYPYRAYFKQKKDFVRNIKSLLEQKKTLSMVSDSKMTPTFIDDFVYALKYLLNNFSPGIFHLVGANSLSPYEAGKLIAQIFNLNQKLVQPTTYKLYSQNRAQRPQYAVIKSKKNNFYRMKTFEKGLHEIIQQLHNYEA